MAQQSQFDGQLLDQKREDVYVLMHQQMSGYALNRPILSRAALRN